jgi:YVTN family beta-propeller protein
VIELARFKSVISLRDDSGERIPWPSPPGGARAYVTSALRTTVSVIDTAINTVVATVPVSLGIAIADVACWHDRAQFGPAQTCRARDGIYYSLRGLALNQRPLGYEPFPNRNWSLSATTTPRELALFTCVALALFGSRRGQLPG